MKMSKDECRMMNAFPLTDAWEGHEPLMTPHSFVIP